VEQLLLVNPRRKSRRKSRRRRSGRMPAALKRYWATHRRGRRRVSLTRRRRRRHAVAAVNPRRHRRHIARRHHSRRRIRRNPSMRGIMGGGRGLLKSTVVPGVIGAGGAIALDIVMGYAQPYLPTSLQTGWFNIAVKIAGAVGVGMVVGKVLGREKGRIATIGGVTVVAYSTLRGMLKTALPSVPGLGAYMDYTPYRMGAYMPGPTGTPGIRGLGYVSPAATIGSQTMMSPRMSGLGAYMPRGPMNVAPAMGDYGDGM